MHLSLFRPTPRQACSHLFQPVGFSNIALSFASSFSRGLYRVQHHLRSAPAGVAAQHMSSMAVPTTANLVPTEVDPAVDDAPPSHLLRLKSNFCRVCGSKMQLLRPPGDHAWRHVCSSPQCGTIEYHNPRMVVGAIVEHEDKILLCRRAIEPCKGLWTVPAGYMELSETTEQGAARETREEASAEISICAPYAHWDIPVIGQAYILFRAKLAAPFTHAPGPESLETRLFTPDELPFQSIAFSSVALSLRLYLEDKQSGQWRYHHGVIDKKPGAGPNDPATFSVSQLVQLPGGPVAC